MTEADLPAVQAMADRLHPHHPEAPAVFAERLALAPAGCRVLAGGGGVPGYAVPHPWTGTAPPPLPRATLVAISGTGDYWMRQGFHDAPVGNAAALASYGAGARFMARPG